MNGHPGGLEHTRHMLELAALPVGASVLDLGAGAGETLTMLRDLGCAAEGIDLAPRSGAVKQGDFLRTPYPDSSFDALLSQCAFFVSGDQAGALREAWRLLKSGGTLLLSDVFLAEPQPLLEQAGFTLLHAENMTAAWREHYLEALWRGEDCGCTLPRGKSSYWLLIGRKDG